MTDESAKNTLDIIQAIKTAVEPFRDKPFSLYRVLSEIRFMLQLRAIEIYRGNVAKAAEHLHICRTTLVESIRSNGLKEEVSKIKAKAIGMKLFVPSDKA